MIHRTREKPAGDSLPDHSQLAEIKVYRSFHVKYIVRTHRGRQTSLGGFKTRLDFAPNGEKAMDGEASPRDAERIGCKLAKGIKSHGYRLVAD
jgi:hypothetical protein